MALVVVVMCDPQIGNSLLYIRCIDSRSDREGSELRMEMLLLMTYFRADNVVDGYFDRMLDTIIPVRKGGGRRCRCD